MSVNLIKGAIHLGERGNKISGFAARVNKFSGLFPECTLGTVYGRLDWSKVAP